MALCTNKPNQRGRCTQFGLEVPETVTWRNWEPGKEYTKTIPIKNIKIKTQRIHYKVPSLQVFSSHYPHPISLSSGTSHVISVSFKPVERGVYSDKIVVQTEEGEVEIPIKATLPTPRIELVESVQFGMVALTDTNSLFFKIRNSSEVDVKFHFEVPAPFTISPMQGTMRPREDCQLCCTFTPPQACVYTAGAVCRYEDSCRQLELMGTGKFAYIQVETLNGDSVSVLDFKKVAIGQSLTKTVLLSNKSPVAAPFRTSPLWEQRGPFSPYTCSETSGRIAAFDKQKLRITFAPKTQGGPFLDYVRVECVGSLTGTTVQCTGEAVTPEVRLSSSCLEFSSVPCGSATKRVVEVENSSSVETLFQFLSASGTVFSVEPCVGRIRANSKTSLTVTFSPSDPIPYSRQLSCLVHRQQPLLLDVLGSGTMDAANPVLLKHRHLQMYRQRFLRGLAPYPPDQLKIWQREKLIRLTTDSVYISPEAAFIQDLTDSSLSEDPFQALFTPNSTSQFVLDLQEIEFGPSSPSTQTIHVVTASNRSKGVISCVWRVPPEYRENFNVTPRGCEVSPGASVQFSVLFSPTQTNRFYDSTLECYGYFKSQKDYHLVEEECVSPSWCNLVQVSGHTWKRGVENSPSSLSWDSREVLFQPLLPGSTAYKTVSLSNKLGLPIQFRFRESEHIQVIPKLGLLREEEQVFILRMTGLSTPGLVSSSLVCDVNHDTEHPELLIVCGRVEAPKLSFPDGDHIYFHACVAEGKVTKRIRVHNTSLLPVQFEWRTQGAEPGITQIEPAQGRILPNEVQSHAWTFSPKREGRHAFRGILSSSFPDSGAKHGSEQLCVSLVGDCCRGELYVTEGDINLGHVTVRSTHKETLTLINSCQCDLAYQLSYTATYTHEGDTQVCGGKEVELSPSEGTVTSGSRHFVHVALRPEHQGRYQLQLFYQIATGKRHTPAARSLLLLSAEVCYPSLSVVDAVLLSGPSGHVSKPRLWEMLGLDTLNGLLSQAPSYEEMRYDIATRHSMKRRIPVLTRAVLDFNFCSAPLRAPDSEVLLLLENRTPVPVEFAFQLPEDMYLEPEYWADTGELDQFEARELYLMENRIFSVDRKTGSLGPGERREVRCSHKHQLGGESSLPVLLKIRRGREVLLNFRGITSPLSAPHVNILSDTFLFRPIPVGLLLPPLQSYKLYNGGDAACAYELDTGPLADMAEQTNGLQVLECLNPAGSIAAYGSTELLFLFTPSQPVQYSTDLLLKYGQEARLITFVGEGFAMGAEDSDALLPDRQEVVRVPVKQLIESRAEIAALSSNTVRFQHLPLFSPARRITFLTNKSKRTLSFEWRMPSDRVSEVLTIKPARGYLHPDQCILCQVIFVSDVDPAFYDVTVSCVIVDESSMVAYKQDLREWERKQVEMQHMFTISSNDGEETSKVAKRHNTLPPLEQESYEEWSKKDLSRRSKHRPRKNKELTSPKPVPPSPFALELCVSARTHSITDYCTLFPHSSMPYINTHQITSAMHSADRHMTHTDATSHLLSSLLSSLLHDLIHESTFTAYLSSIGEEPTPYFVQFQRQKPPKQLELSSSFDGDMDGEGGGSRGEHSTPRVGSAPVRLRENSPPIREAVQPSAGQTDRLKKLDSAHVLLEGVLENSLRCILSEALQEIDITAKPHIIAMPPHDTT